MLPLGQTASVSVFGTGKTLSITNGTSNYGLSFGTTSAWGLRLNSSPTANVGASVSETSIATNKALGISTNASNSGLKGTVNLADATGAKAIVCIKY